MKKPVTSLVVALLLLGGLTQPLAAAPDPTPVVFVGDSITELCNANFESFRPHAIEELSGDGYLIDAVGSLSSGACATPDPEHEGKASDDTGEVLARLPGGLAGLGEAPEVAFVLLGTNDVQDGLTVLASITNLEGIIAALRSENSTMHIVLGTIPPYPGKPSETAALNAAIAGLAESGPSPVTVVDLHAQIVSATHLAADDIHLSPGGAAFVGQLVSDALVATGQLAEEAPTAPVALDAEGGENEIALSWAPPLDDGGHSIIDYAVELTGPESQSLTITAPTSEASFSNLDAGTYAVSVSARNQKFTGPAVTMTGLVVNDPPPPPSPWAPFADEEAFITQQYLDFLGRSPDASGLEYWESLTNDDQSNVAGVIEGFMLSPEFAPRRSVARLYLAFFDRSPDNGGFDYWTESIASGTANLDTVSQSFVQSQEFATTYGSLSDAGFVDLVYTNVLGRSADQGGYDFWLAEMGSGMTRGQVMTRFSESPEYVEGTRANVDVAVTYRGMLDREPEQSGYDFWVGQIATNPNSLLSLISAFFETAEYAERVQN